MSGPEGAPFAPSWQDVQRRTTEFLTALNAQYPDYGSWTADAGGKRYIRVVHNVYNSRSAYAFIDLSNGDILKPASFKGPAKHARGNIFAADLGLNCCGRYSVAYMGRGRS